MARSKKTSLLKKFTNWIKGSIDKFAAEGFSKEERKKRAKYVPSFLKVRKRKAKPQKKKTAPKKKRPLKKNAAKVSAKKAVAKRSLVKKPVAVSAEKAVLTKKLAAPAQPAGIFVGKITHSFPKAGACAVKIEKAELKQGASIRILGKTTDFKMAVKSIQINRIPVPSGRPGEDVGIGVSKSVEVGDGVYLI